MLPPRRHGSKSECTAHVVCVLTWIKSCGGGRSGQRCCPDDAATVNADRGSRSDPRQHSCHEDNNGGGKRHPLRKDHFLPLCVTVPVLRPLAS